jgi:hypothetical protein
MASGIFHIFGVEFALEKFDSVAAGTFLLAVATFFLALVTYRLLRAAKDERETALDALAAAEEQARIAQRQADVAERTLSVQMQPVLVEMPVSSSGSLELVSFPGTGQTVPLPVGGVYAGADVPGRAGPEVRLAVPFLNAGRGIAAISYGWIEIYGPRGFRAIDFARPNVPVGSETYAFFLFRQGELGFDEVGDLIRRGSEILVAVQYSDISRRQTRTTRFWIRFQADARTGWVIYQVEVGDPDTGVPPPPGAV